RADLTPYFSLPFYRAMLERSGFGDDIAGFDEGMQKGDQQAAVGSISDRFLQTLTAIGDPDEAAASVRRYRDAGATSPCLGGVAGVRREELVADLLVVAIGDGLLEGLHRGDGVTSVSNRRAGSAAARAEHDHHGHEREGCDCRQRGEEAASMDPGARKPHLP